MAQIQLSPEEKRFCDLLNGFSQTLEPPVECRIAGGWVRDKLLALPSHDLDIALPLASGYTFATQFVDYIRKTTPSEGDGAVSLASVGRVAANPEQSKHLETGTTKIMGLECDFVGLRSETYTDSRIPDQVRLGTPEEDALRRDLTINALFYNVATESIEDWTQRGLPDLQALVARTPLPPRQTFLDDPLRVLRTIRFAGRYNLRVEEEVAEAALDPEIQAALRTKVSKERIGIEITKTFLKSPLASLHLIANLHLHSAIFTCPPLPHSDEPTSDSRATAVATADMIQQIRERWPEMAEVDGMEHVWLAAALQPYEGMMVVGKKEVPAVSVCVAEGLKLSTEINKAVSSLFTSQTLLSSILESQSRSEIGLVLQNQAVRPWRRSVLWSAARAVQALNPPASASGATPEWDERSEAELHRWKVFVRKVAELDLEKDIDMPLLVDGKSVLPLLQIKPGPLLQVILHAIRVYQLDHPSATKAEVEEWVKAQWESDRRQEWEAMAPPVTVAKGKKRKGGAA